MLEIQKAKGPPIDYPEEPNKLYDFVAQNHFRGRSCHLDLRFSRNGILEGWTIAHQRPGAIKEPVLTLAQARRLAKDPKTWKLDLRTGKILPRKVRTKIKGKERVVIRPGLLFASRKAAEIPKDWLRIEGVTRKPEPGEKPPVGATRQFPGVFHILDSGKFTFGARKPWFFEYFMDGKVFRGRYAFRLVARVRKQEDDVLPFGTPEAEARLRFYWTFMGTLSGPPYVLSQEAIEKNWLPPVGAAALPPRIRNSVPRELRYWELEDEEEALEARRKLAEGFEELGGPNLLS